MLKYVQSMAKIIWMIVSNVFPFQSSEEYPKSWINKRSPQNMDSPSAIFFPIGVVISSCADVKQSNPMSNTKKAMKKVCTNIICRLIKLNGARSFFHAKYLGNTT